MPMTVPRTNARLAAASNGQWLLVDQSAEERVTVAVVGGLMADRAEELWSSVEYALEVADGRPVTVDLTAVTGFDLDTVEAVRDVIRTAARRRDDVEIRLMAGSALDDYTRGYGLVHRIVRGAPPGARTVTVTSCKVIPLVATSRGHSGSGPLVKRAPARTRAAK
jgi:hypothetical protein